MKKKNIDLLNFLILFFLYIAIVSFPFAKFITNQIWLNFALMMALLLYCTFALMFITRNVKVEEKPTSFKAIFILLPCLLVCFSNLIVGAYTNTLVWEIDVYLLLMQIVVSLVTATAEEILFRQVLFNLFKNKSGIVRVIICAAIFGACHLLNLFSSSPAAVFAQVGYTFFTGLIFGMLYEYGHSIIPCILFHFAFNAINMNLAEMVFKGSSDLSYYLINIIVGFIVGLYLLCVYLLVFRKEEKK